MWRKLARFALAIVVLVVVFFAGWSAAVRIHAGEQAMGNFIELVSAMAFLEKGDQASAFRTLQLSTEGNLLKVAKYGTPILDWYEPAARKNWLQRYAQIRDSHPKIDYPGDEGLRREIDKILSKR